LSLCGTLIRELNRDPEFAKEEPFYLLHRDLQFSSSEQQWIGWERKRGKILQFLRFVHHGENSFSQTVGDMERLRQTEYVLIMDDDLQLCSSSLQLLLATHLHPLNHPHIERGSWVRGFGILQPSIQLLHGSPDLWGEDWRNPEKLPGEWIFDLLGRTPFYGKGLVHVRSYYDLIEGAIPEGIVLSHDIIESGFVPCGRVFEAVIGEPLPTGHAISCQRIHRWLRGDWQNTYFLLATRAAGRQLPRFGRFVIVRHLKVSLWDISVVVALFCGAALQPSIVLWVVVIVMLPSYVDSALDALHGTGGSGCITVSRILREAVRPPLQMFHLVRLAGHGAMVAADAIIRSVIRLTTGRKLLQWEASTSAAFRGSRFALCTVYLWLEIVVTLVGAGFAIIRYKNYPVACLSVLWLISAVDVLVSKSREMPQCYQANRKT
jgi:cyclic beta-1,2-glucan synthetase